MKIEIIESRKANAETVDNLLREGTADVVIIDDYDTPDEEGAAARKWSHVIANRESEQHVDEYLRLCAERVKPTPAGFTRFYVTTDAHSARSLLSFRINARVFVDHLEEGQEPDISLESKVRDALDGRKKHTTGIVRTWVAGQVGRAIWIQDDSTARLVPYFLSELQLVKN